MKYQWLLFDADETLFSFDDFAGLKVLFKDYDVVFSEQDYAQYKALNKPLWVDYQEKKISADTLKTERFTHWAKRLNVSAYELNSGFLNAMAKVCLPLPGAETLLEALSSKVNMAIITNGFTELQQVRLENTGLKKYFADVIISEQVGMAKPDIEIFDHALNKLGHQDRSSVLMVGDNPHSDILGGMRAGMDTCWLNHHQNPVPEGIKPTYQVADLHQLKSLLLP
ncbi:nucleotidase [Marinomonas sp. MED121]|uniref:pyrimidine 5'-nucleotidase n=1 Tax=Marinomonas sp. MED121 TaxID=314277 RepID=UPI0000690F91|nr:pyrimidine 5'-nucleotidase [Marinomonas sp. MED121]EAQ67306.1 nucleotidase [Marinomonas sp. MED121]